MKISNGKNQEKDKKIGGIQRQQLRRTHDRYDAARATTETMQRATTQSTNLV
jgi:hypothetical protein